MDGFIINLGGTVFRGNNLIDGVFETIFHLKKLEKKVVFLSNRGNILRKMCYSKLCQMGLDVSEEKILLSSTVAANDLKAYFASSAVWVFGEQGLKDELIEAEVRIASRPEEADWLLITLHESVTYKDLNDAFRAVRHGARIIATNTDTHFPSEDGDSIDVAGMIGAVVASTGKEVDVVIGKPSHYMVEAALKVLGQSPESCLVVGDSLASDICLGKRFGIKTALVLSGSVQLENVKQSKWQPDWIWNYLGDLNEYLTTGWKCL
ncbi:HAD-IIA family hydrolase [Bacillaceae bacterium SIJ1]|uniref:HAD-IIA family hydrolase n=1 Tax=Litoribacterium kuwaitense TaxID=1398745 RepID=UPI0013EC2443|nr:HAD-IIA family hydrolase [Litoribacterium kuwaitense]NGP45257.1 HAD-IIA family hydrolase [Litoribacterium kuwaitense]